MEIPNILLKIAAIFFDVIFVLFVAYIVFVFGLRIYWKRKAKKMKGTEIPMLNSDFTRLKKGKGVIYFYAPNCKPCKLIDPIIKKLSKEFKKVHFIKINVAESPDTARSFGILATPSIIITKNGKIEEVLMGPVPERTLREKIS